MADFIPQGVRGVFEKLVPRLSKMHTLLLPSHQRTFVKTTEHPWTKTILSRGGRRNLFNPDLMNKLIRIKWLSEWVNEWAPSTDIRPLTKLMDVTHPWGKNQSFNVCKFTVKWLLNERLWKFKFANQSKWTSNQSKLSKFWSSFFSICTRKSVIIYTNIKKNPNKN